MTVKQDAIVRVDDIIRLSKRLDDCDRAKRDAYDDYKDAKNLYETALRELRDALRGRPLQEKKG